jgi:hypothetical protein
MVGKILEGTFVAVALYLVLTNAAGFGQATSAIGSLYTSGVQTLQGR